MLIDGPSRWPRRYVLIFLCFAATFICYIDRVSISVAIIPMAQQFGWSATTKGFVLSSFFVGYLIAMLPSGKLAYRFGGKTLLGAALISWSVCTLLHPFVAGVSLTLLIATRIVMGMGEAATFPAIYNLLARWFPVHERTRAVAINHAGIPAGTVFALLASAWLVAHHGWQSVFYAFGGAGIVFSAFWFRFVHASPTTHPTISKAELAVLSECSAAVADRSETVTVRRMLRQPAVVALTIAHFSGNWTFYMLLSWLPSYFRDVLHLPVQSSGLLSIGPWISFFVGLNGSAMLADWLIAKGYTLTRVRKTLVCIGLLGAMAGLLTTAIATTPGVALVGLCGGLGLFGSSASNVFSSTLDIAPRHADVLMSIMNTVGTIPGVIGVAVAGYLVDLTGGYTASFVLAAVINVIGASVWAIWGSCEKAFD